MMPSQFQVSTTPETCKGCGLCAKRCPMGAFALEKSPLAKNKTGKVSVLKAELCIGCGICAYKCPTKSLKLVPRENPPEIPKTPRDYAVKVTADFMAANPRLQKRPAE